MSSVPPEHSPDLTEAILTGARVLRRAFLAEPAVNAVRGTVIIRADERKAACFLIRRGFGYRAHALADGRRAIVDVLIPGDIGGLDHIMMVRPFGETIAASQLTYQRLEPAAVRELMNKDLNVASRLAALLTETNWRIEQHAAIVTRLDARERLTAFILSIYQRLRRRGLINGLSFNLPLTQEQMADHLGLTLVHVNRTLRRLREEHLAIVDRQVVMIRDFEGMRDLLRGLPEPAYVPSPILTDLG